MRSCTLEFHRNLHIELRVLIMPTQTHLTFNFIFPLLLNAFAPKRDSARNERDGFQQKLHEKNNGVLSLQQNSVISVSRACAQTLNKAKSRTKSSM